MFVDFFSTIAFGCWNLRKLTSSVLGRVLNLDFDDQFDAADDLNAAKIDFTDLQNCEVDNINEIQLAEYEKSLQGLVSESERSHYEVKLRNSGFSTKLSLPCSDSSFLGVILEILVFALDLFGRFLFEVFTRHGNGTW
ncbi:hypothetical protein U1Q18_027840 [Sarracenia purpurea var. burkii]